MAGRNKSRKPESLIDEAKLHHDGRLVALGTMAAGLAHELNQPLNAICVMGFQKPS